MPRITWDSINTTQFKDDLDIKAKDILTEWRLEETHSSLNEKLKQLGETILESANHCRKLEDIKLNDAHDRDPRIEELISKRRSLGQNQGSLRKDIAKELQKLLKKETRRKQNEKVGKILDEFRGLKQITGIRNNGKKSHIASVLNAEGLKVQHPDDIAKFLQISMLHCTSPGKKCSMLHLIWRNGGKSYRQCQWTNFAHNLKR